MHVRCIYLFLVSPPALQVLTKMGPSDWLFDITTARYTDLVQNKHRSENNFLTQTTTQKAANASKDRKTNKLELAFMNFVSSLKCIVIQSECPKKYFSRKHRKCCAMHIVLF